MTQLKKELEKNLPRSSNSLIIGDIPFTSRAKKVLEFAVEEARSLNHNYIGTEHLLLGLLKEKEGVACRVLNSFGMFFDDVREKIVDMFKEPTESNREVGKTPTLDEFSRDLTKMALSKRGFGSCTAGAGSCLAVTTSSGACPPHLSPGSN